MIIEQWDKRKINSKTFAIPILNKNTKGAKKCKANQKQQLSTKKFDITQRPRSLEYNDYNVDNGYN